jgi:hypothetical protein
MRILKYQRVPFTEANARSVADLLTPKELLTVWDIAAGLPIKAIMQRHEIGEGGWQDRITQIKTKLCLNEWWGAPLVCMRAYGAAVPSSEANVSAELARRRCSEDSFGLSDDELWTCWAIAAGLPIDRNTQDNPPFSWKSRTICEVLGISDKTFSNRCRNIEDKLCISRWWGCSLTLVLAFGFKMPSIISQEV